MLDWSTSVFAAQAAPQPAKGASAAVIAWTGASNTAWHVSANWSGGAVPGAADDVMIDGAAGTNHPTINLAGGAVTIKSLTIGSTTNATLTFKNSLAIDDNRRLRVSGNVTIGAKGQLTHALETATGVGPEIRPGVERRVRGWQGLLAGLLWRHAGRRDQDRQNGQVYVRWLRRCDLVGLTPHVERGEILLQPHLPADWPGWRTRAISLGHEGEIRLALVRGDTGCLTLTVERSGGS